jgi:hypothetical protein
MGRDAEYFLAILLREYFNEHIKRLILTALFLIMSFFALHEIALKDTTNNF